MAELGCVCGVNVRRDVRRWRELTWPLCSGSVRSALTHLWPLQVWWLLAALLLSQHLTHTTSTQTTSLTQPRTTSKESLEEFMVRTFQAERLHTCSWSARLGLMRDLGDYTGWRCLTHEFEFPKLWSFSVKVSVTELHGGLAAVRGVNLHCRRLLHPSAELNWEQQIQSPVSQNVNCIRKGSISVSTNGRVRIVLREGTDFKCNYKCGVTQ